MVPNMTEGKRGIVSKISRYFLIIVLVAAFAGVATLAAMSDSSIHGLTIRFYNVTWNCAPTDLDHPNPFLIFRFGSVVVYSSASLPTTLSHVTFSMSTNGVQVGTVSEQDSSFGPGQNALYTLAFNNTGLDPHSQPLQQRIILTINAQVSAGIYSSQALASDSELVKFSTQACP